MKNQTHTQAPQQAIPPQAGLPVIIAVASGMVEVLFKPAGVELTLFDYDVEGIEDGLSRDIDGNDCLIRLWPTSQRVTENRHWPMIRHAMRASHRANARLWRCPDCNRTVSVTYEGLAESGSPYCPDCDTEMSLI